MLKKIPVILLVLVFTLLLFADGASAQQMKKYTDKEGHFTLSYPSNWEMMEGFQGTVVSVVSPMESEQDQFRENVNVVIEPLDAEISLEDYFEMSRQNLREAFQSYQEHDSGEVNLGGVKAKRLVYSFKIENISVKCLLYVVVKGKYAYAVTGGSTPQDFAKHLKQLEAVAGSFRLLK